MEQKHDVSAKRINSTRRFAPTYLSICEEESDKEERRMETVEKITKTERWDAPRNASPDQKEKEGWMAPSRGRCVFFVAGRAFQQG